MKNSGSIIKIIPPVLAILLLIPNSAVAIQPDQVTKFQFEDSLGKGNGSIEIEHLPIIDCQIRPKGTLKYQSENVCYFYVNIRATSIPSKELSGVLSAYPEAFDRSGNKIGYSQYKVDIFPEWKKFLIVLNTTTPTEVTIKFTDGFYENIVYSNIVYTKINPKPASSWPNRLASGACKYGYEDKYSAIVGEIACLPILWEESSSNDGFDSKYSVTINSSYSSKSPSALMVRCFNRKLFINVRYKDATTFGYQGSGKIRFDNSNAKDFAYMVDSSFEYIWLSNVNDFIKNLSKTKKFLSMKIVGDEGATILEFVKSDFAKYQNKIKSAGCKI